MDIHSFTVGPFAENTYLLEQDGQALLIDPGFSTAHEYKEGIAPVKESDLELQAVVLTHAHIDHVLGLSRVLDEFDVPVFLSDENRYLWEHISSQASQFGMQAPAFDFQPQPLESNAVWQKGPFRFDLRFTPGHAPDHISLYHKDGGFVIAGDALFKEGIGRTDLYSGSMEVLKRSIRQQLYSLADETVVYPGHGPSTTIGHEKTSNPFVQMG